MLLEKRIDDMIEAGWHVLASDFDPAAFEHWRAEAFKCLAALLGPDHTYTRSFRNYVQSASDKTDLLIGGGILTAAKEEAANREASTGQAEQ
jgi:hypothetical protein